ncbi:MAG: rRNA maturation RNase YbeY [Pseudomonadota bacterium]
MTCRSGGWVSIVFIDDRSIAALAGRFREEGRATDVLAFDYTPDAQKGSLSGEIFISLDTALRQARERAMPVEKELILLSVHGLLHLSGLGDETRSEWRAMRRAEFETMMQIV